ncbi:hypothetical protein QBC47DRAFT_143217 [Echria macrotheca]|uniref:Neurofilament medium polypeptide protein n=1 Tax=Echria macrotheca TaxID=438768 RepID=A0AAJ0FCM5_9PEZI|nr:hypothetical protein QBC47DRAFT_143217 [Echria macrotheca]
MKSPLYITFFLSTLCSGRAIASSDSGSGPGGGVGQENFLAGAEHFRLLPAFLGPRQVQTNNLQAFTGSLGGVRASAITKSSDPGREFEVDGDTFSDFETAANRACDNQFNKCADVANSGNAGFKVGDCDKQNVQCKSFQQQTPTKAFAPPVLVSSTAEFDIFCDA